jgi:hypothetical protein
MSPCGAGEKFYTISQRDQMLVGHDAVLPSNEVGDSSIQQELGNTFNNSHLLSSFFFKRNKTTHSAV